MALLFLAIPTALVVFSNSIAQPHFKEYPLAQTFYSGIPIAAADINGDHWDDLAVLDNTKHLHIGLSTGDGNFIWQALNYHAYFPAWSINVADLDNNGYNDIVISGESTNVHVYYQSPAGFSQEIIDHDYFLSQGASVADINQDGWLDFTLCDDNNAPRVYVNDGHGKLISNTSLIDLNVEDPRYNEGNYGSIWIDFDWDNDLDLYISKCRSNATEPTDLRRINRLYVRDNGIWTEKGAQYGVNTGAQSWCAVSEDFDNDGLFDIFVINHYDPCTMYKQRPNHTFVKVNANIGYDGGGIQALPFDFDNDGDVDLIIAGTVSKFYRNDGGMKFSEVDLPIIQSNFSSCAVGDFNRDGFLDLYTSYSRLFNTPLNLPDRLWLNEGNTNHFVQFQLLGTQSNRNGINTKVKLYAQGKLQVRELHGGDAFGINNSLQVHFGLGTATKVDSVIFYWPSGQIDRHRDVVTNQLHVVEEAKCIYYYPRGSENRKNFCEPVNTSITADGDVTDITWNNGQKTAELNITKEGIYYYTAKNRHGCRIVSPPCIVRQTPRLKIPLSFMYDQYACAGTSLNVVSEFHPEVEWQDGSRSKQFTVSSSGPVFARLKDVCSHSYSDTINFHFFEVPGGEAKTDTLYRPDRAVLRSPSENTRWYATPTDTQVLFVGKEFITDTIRQSQSFFAESFADFVLPSLKGGLAVPDFHTGPYHNPGLNVSTLFYVYKPIILESVTVFTDDEGDRKIILKNSKDSIIASALASLKKGANHIVLNFPIEPDEFYYSLTTDVSTNLKTFGINSPQLYHSDRNFYFPFFIEDKVKIVSTDIGDRRYCYFYDWTIRPKDLHCAGKRTEYRVVLSNVSTDVESAAPNAWYDALHKDLIVDAKHRTQGWELIICNIAGALVDQRVVTTSQPWRYSMRDLPNGLYIVKLRNTKNNRRQIFKCLVH